jgi:hypothetical protein
MKAAQVRSVVPLMKALRKKKITETKNKFYENNSV